MSRAVVTGTSYCLVHAPSMLLDHGTTTVMERQANPNSEFLARLPAHLRSYADAVAYPPNQAFIGGLSPFCLAEIPRPWHRHPVAAAQRSSRYGEVMPEDEFLAWLRLADSFDLVFLADDFLAELLPRFSSHPLVTAADVKRVEAGARPRAEIAAMTAGGAAEGLTLAGRLIGCVRRAHDRDETLAAHIMLENLVTKASGILALRRLLAGTGLDPAAVDYAIECSEEACGDMNQRGGGNFAKAIAELAGCTGATGADIRAFCAGPAHAMVAAAALVQAGVYRHVAVLAGGALAKLGLNSRDQVARGLPALEDVIGAFAILVSPDDGVNPRLRTDVVGRHRIGSGSSPQAVMSAIVAEPLRRAGLRLTDVDRYSVEMHNPELTEPAGAGDVPKSNYRMIAALAVKNGEIARTDLDAFVAARGVPGFAPTQGHVPSGVPLIGPFRDAMLAGELERAQIIGKGSLFLARMTSLFDGVSFLMERNPGGDAAGRAGRVRVAVTLFGSEHGPEEVVRGAEQAQARRPDIAVCLIGAGAATALPVYPAADLAAAHRVMEDLLEGGEVQAAVTMHYNFPIGVATVGRVLTPARGRPLLLATTTGAAAADRVEALVRGAIGGAAVARALGMAEPAVGLLNLEGAPQAEVALRRLAAGGYPLRWAGSGRADGGALLRGNDLLQGVPDVMVCDSLTGNVLMKVCSAYTTGGSYEALGWGYGPGVGPGYGRIIGIVSRASGAPVIAGAVAYAADAALGDLPAQVAAEYELAEEAGLAAVLGAPRGAAPAAAPAPAGGEVIAAGDGATPPGAPPAPPAKAVTHEIPGIDILALEEAVHHLWSRSIYAASGMGCTGPVVLVAAEDAAAAHQALATGGYL